MRQPIIPYNPQLKQRARELRRKMTLAEILLWKRLKGKQLCGYDFDHQRPVGRRIVDFYCKELKLAVDVDGSVHDFRRAQDERRRGEIEALGVKLLRFWNYDVKNDIHSVLKKIEGWIRAEEQRRGLPGREANKRPTPNPSRGGERPTPDPSGGRERPTPDPSRGGERPTPDPSGGGERAAGAVPPSSPPGRGQGWVKINFPNRAVEAGHKNEDRK